jgi:GGDEF domain-containing protein
LFLCSLFRAAVAGNRPLRRADGGGTAAADIERHSNSDNAKDESVRVQYTVSIGLAVLRDAGSLKSLVRRADAALYQAKASGRNRVVCESLASRPENCAASSS